MRINNVCILLISLLLAGGTAYSQAKRTEIRVDFRVNSIVIDSAYSDNTAHVQEIIDFLRNVSQDSTLTLLEVSFCGAASPEGSYQLNRKLARGRLDALEKVVRNAIEINDSIITRDDSYISWEYLREQVEQSDIPQKQAILEIIDMEPKLMDYPGNRHIDHRVFKLQSLDKGRVWRNLLDNYFNRMRNAYAVFIVYKEMIPPTPEPVSVPEPVDVPEPEASPVDTIEVPEVEEWSRKLHLKTNAIGLGMGIVNAAAEIDLAKHWSFTLPVYYSALNYFTSTIKFRTLAVQPEVRYWLSDDNSGFFAGAHFGLASYNIAVDGDYRYQDHNENSPAIGGGLSVGYRMPISADKKWNMEFSLGAGVYDLYYDKFMNTPNTSNGLLVESVKKTYWGVDQVAVTFTYKFDLMKKGGKR